MIDFTPRFLDWPNCLNARDLGGMPTADGSAIRAGALVRTDNHSKLTAEGIEAVRAYGVSRIIDLRRERECARRPSPFLDTPLYLNVPVQDPADPDHRIPDLAEIYRQMLDARPELFAEAMAAIADAPDGAVVVHCVAGKDRTGMVVAMALTLAGVAPELIAADYELTEARLAEESAGVLERIADPEVRALTAALQPTPAKNMHRVLDHLRDGYGGVAAYLAAAGVSSAQLAAIRERLLG